MNIDQKLKAARKAAGLTQEALAEKINVSRQTISSWENGRSYPDIISIVLLSDIYQVSLDHLLKGDDQMLKELEKDTNVVKSNRKLIGIYLGCILGYGILYLILPMLQIPKIENLIINILILVGVGLALLIQLVRYLQRTEALKRSTSNVVLAKIAIIFTGVLVIIGAFELLQLFVTVSWQMAVGRLLICLVGGGIVYVIIRKLRA
ncbi:helix-turn-helix transcriptional regulator [Enterococcus sp. HY326]|uniref:helix-turn-helix domain-containing protein n=1 Tax=Enterococcus sp. HY326 TaxID=2971265 RepID=UPI002ACE078B|nr:helix-turn-helix transcriptional regulator [Enterococcus sp. HY326]